VFEGAPQKLSERTSFTNGHQVIAGYQVTVQVNAKNSYGAYSGFSTYYFLFRDNKMINVSEPSSLGGGTVNVSRISFERSDRKPAAAFELQEPLSISIKTSRETPRMEAVCSRRGVRMDATVLRPDRAQLSIWPKLVKQDVCLNLCVFKVDRGLLDLLHRPFHLTMATA
jgi:hypothetical protein